MKLHPLPSRARELLTGTGAPPLLMAHLTVTHEVAAALLAGLSARWPELELDTEAVLFGAATHDLGKVRHPQELSAPGTRHEAEGERLLLELGIAARLARFCRSHGEWGAESPLEDLLVALADKVWKGCRIPELEDLITTRLSEQLGLERWSVYLALDDMLAEIAQRADERLRWLEGHGR
ncbi:MAG: HD domain-containing protein [Armatimonadota bacterium]